MAIVRFGAGIQQISGKEGGGIWHTDQFGQHLIAGPRKRNKQPSPAQLAIRKAYRKVCNFWLAYSLDEPATFSNAWHAYATTHEFTNRIGEPIHLTSFNTFVKFNMPRVLNGLVATFDPPLP